MLNCLFFRIFPPFVLSGCGLLPANSIWQGAGGPATSQMRCWLLPNGRIFPAAAGLLCVLNPRFSALPARRRNVGFSRCAAHTTRCRGRKPHTAATRASRRGAGARPANRVDRVDVSHGGKIGTIDPFQADQPLSVTLSERYENAVFP